MSFLYAALDVVTILLATDIPRHAPIVYGWGVIAVVLGVVIVWIGVAAEMPARWIWGEGPLIAAIGIAVHGLLLVSRHAEGPPGQTQVVS